MGEVYDYIVVGSGFGGSVSAMRLAEKGYRVLVIEKGKRWRTEDFPTSNRSLHKYLWVPRLRFFGIQKLSFFRKVFVISGVGVGGGSLVYANTLLQPPDTFFENPAWAGFKDWKNVLAPYYARARKMLGATPAKNHYPEDDILREVARDMQREETYHNVEVGVYYGDTQKETDPYFGGEGPLRKGCIECAGCMVGCRHNAKNTLDKNYLFFAEKKGAVIMAETLVTRISHDAAKGTYLLHTECSTGWWKKDKKEIRARGLVISGGVLGTQELLLKQKYEYKTLPSLSDTLGRQVRTNSESICGVLDADRRLNHGVAISSGFYPAADTQIEIVKFPDKSDAMLRLGTLAADGPRYGPRIARFFGQIITRPGQYFRTIFIKNAPRNGIILLVMQTLDNQMKMVWKKGFWGGKMRLDNAGDSGGRVPTFIPAGQEVMHRYAAKVQGVPMNAATEIFFNMSTTAHILGGCPMGNDATDGVVNERFEVFGYPNMYILDGSVIPCNLGVNPSLTITALAEYAMDQIKPKTDI